MAKDLIQPTYSSQLARAVTQKIKFHVNTMINKSRVIDQQEKNLGIFDKSEIKIGALLGSGGFSDVYEVLAFEPNEFLEYDESQVASRRNFHEHVTESKYVMKHLKLNRMLDPQRFCMEAADLVMEALLLSNLQHEHIIQLQGWANGGIDAYSSGSHGAYFLILDRLQYTLAEKLRDWRESKLDQSFETVFEPLSSNGIQQLLSRMMITKQIASAVAYLHSRDVIFRDLKPNNVGFDERGIVKIFDFGLSRELPSENYKIGDVYSMSGNVGTIRYMAPEVAMGRAYNQKVDVYSWAILFWECITLEKPFDKMTRSMHKSLVCNLGLRPKLSDDMPAKIKNILRNAWTEKSQSRWNMVDICAYLNHIESDYRSASKVATQSMALAPTSLLRSKSLSITPRKVVHPVFQRSTSNSLALTVA
jgi:serine/threonine protein kinase